MEDSIRNELMRAVGMTFGAIAADVEGDDIEWAELVCDADRIFMFGGELSIEAVAEWKAMSWEEKTRFAESCNYW